MIFQQPTTSHPPDQAVSLPSSDNAYNDDAVHADTPAALARGTHGHRPPLSHNRIAFAMHDTGYGGLFDYITYASHFDYVVVVASLVVVVLDCTVG